MVESDCKEHKHLGCSDVRSSGDMLQQQNSSKSQQQSAEIKSILIKKSHSRPNPPIPEPIPPQELNNSTTDIRKPRTRHPTTDRHPDTEADME